MSKFRVTDGAGVVLYEGDHAVEAALTIGLTGIIGIRANPGHDVVVADKVGRSDVFSVMVNDKLYGEMTGMTSNEFINITGKPPVYKSEPIN